MQILLKVNKSYDFVPTEDKPDPKEINDGDYRRSADGQLLKVSVIKRETDSTANVPDDQIDRLVEHFERNKVPKTRNEVYAWYLEEKVLPNLAPRDGWEEFIVDKDKKLEKYLNNRFELKESK